LTERGYLTIIEPRGGVQMIDRETWRFVNTFAPWLSALGTLTAVIVSLYLARRSARLDVRVSAAIMRIVTVGMGGPQPEFLQIRTVNHGGRDAVINGIGWRLLAIPRRHWIVLAPHNEYSAKLPVKLSFGEEAIFCYPTETFNRDAELLLRRVNDAWFPRLAMHLLTVGVFTSTGQRFFVRLDVHMRKFFLSRAVQVAVSAPVGSGK
jgi:hypothetical protein